MLPGEYICVEFEDEGEGIAPDRLQRVFDPYMHEKRKNGGLGLAVCETIVRRHGGRIGVESIPGKGSTFSVYLPALPKATAASEQGRTAGTFGMGKGSILLMDDEFVIRMTAERLFARLGYEATTVADGKAAIAAFKEARSYGRSFKAVILDLTVPGGMGGAEAVSAIRSIDPAVSIYASSGYDEGAVMTDYAAYGFTGVIPKPYSLEELAARLR
jgi:CheY-like chemotaxis protein